ncbi:MAG: DUF3226 domain-containing protein [Tepidisphaerales bacterium]
MLLAVEGLDYLHLLLRSRLKQDALFQRNALLWDFKQGGNTLGQFLSVLRPQRNFDRVVALGVICDAEQDRVAMTASIRDHLRNNGFAVPEQQGEIAEGRPAVSFLVMPHDEPSGCLEHACLKSAVNRQLAACAEQFLSCVGEKKLNANWQAKLRVHAMIAGCGGNPAMTLGESAEAGVWNFDHPSLAAMLDFISRLCRRV